MACHSYLTHKVLTLDEISLLKRQTETSVSRAGLKWKIRVLQSLVPGEKLIVDQLVRNVYIIFLGFFILWLQYFGKNYKLLRTSLSHYFRFTVMAGSCFESTDVLSTKLLSYL
jgi:hypothetical protein